MPPMETLGNCIQDAINPLLEECEIVFVLFYSKAGDFTIEELRLAEAKGKKIFVYFKTGFAPKTDSEITTFRKAIKLRDQLVKGNRILFQEYADDRGFGELFKTGFLASHAKRTLEGSFCRLEKPYSTYTKFSS